MSDKTRVMRIADNPWPGMYFCGQDALMYAHHLEMLLGESKPEALHAGICRELIQKLRECKQQASTEA